MNIGVGLDLGQAQDYTVFAAVERLPLLHPIPNAPKRKWSYAVRHLEQFELGTPYTDIVAAFKKRLESPSLKGCRVAADYTGVGRPVVDMLKAAKLSCRLEPILTTSGHKSTYDKEDAAWHVPKKDLVSALQVLLQLHLLTCHPKVPLAARFQKQLAEFKVKISRAANEQFGAWADGQHDDIVLAVALICWLFEETGGGIPVTDESVSTGEPSPFAKDLNPEGYFEAFYDPTSGSVVMQPIPGIEN